MYIFDSLKQIVPWNIISITMQNKVIDIFNTTIIDKVWMYEEIMMNDDNLESNLLTSSLLKTPSLYKFCYKLSWRFHVMNCLHDWRATVIYAISVELIMQWE